MFPYQKLRIIFAIGLSMLGFFPLFKRRGIAKKAYTSGTVPGSIMFGVGWALTGTCPSIALVQLGEGQLAALITIIGNFSGVWIYRKIAAPTFQLDTGICGED